MQKQITKQLRGFELYGMLLAKEAELQSMKSCNSQRMFRNESPAFIEEDFLGIEEEVDRITAELTKLNR